MPPKENKFVSDSEHGDMPLDEAIRMSIRDIQTGLCNVEKSLLDLIGDDEITIERFSPCYELSNELIILSKELMEILKEIPPANFAKYRKDHIKTQEKMIDQFKGNGLV